MMKLFFVLICMSAHVFAFDWQGHRGARGLYPENTIGAMEEALKYPVTTLEMDVVISKDHKVVVSHEPWMSEEICLNPHSKNVTGKEYNLYKLTYEDIQKFDCGSILHPRFIHQQKVAVGKPTLEALLYVIERKLREFNRENIQYSIEIKSTPEDEKEGFQPAYKTFSDLVVRVLKNVPTSRYVLQSFDWRVLRYLHENYPEIRLSALHEGSVLPQENLRSLGFSPYIFSPNYSLLKKEDVDFFHAKKILVIPWTVNDVSSMELLLRMGVDGIITDYPNRILDVGQKKCQDGEGYFEGKCIKLPAHALPSDLNPGWICKSGYVQKRARCTKMVIPRHAKLSPDGKSWMCKSGYRRYRGSCKKS